MGPGETEEECSAQSLPPEELIRALKEIPEIQALINNMNTTPRRSYSQPNNYQPNNYHQPNNYQPNNQPNNYPQPNHQTNFTVSPNYRGNYPLPPHEVYQRHRGYNPNHSPSAPRTAVSPRPSWTAAPHQPRCNTLRQIELMITYVVDATTFWAQVVQGDIVQTSLKLEESLKKECPTLPPVQKVGKGHVYGTLFDNSWYRCISCGPPDPDDIVEILFVDYGNKDRKHLNELVWLSAPIFTSVPFLATPFTLPGITPIPEYGEQAISLFSTNDKLKGYVTSLPKLDEYCSIKLLRPHKDQNEPHLRDYHSLLLHKGYVKEVTKLNPPPPTKHYISGLQQRLQYMSQLLREKEHTITNLNKELQSFRDQTPVGVEDQANVGVQDIETEIVPEIPEMVLESMPRAPRTVSEISTPESAPDNQEEEHNSSEEVEVLDERPDVEEKECDKEGGLLVNLLTEVEVYKGLLADKVMENELLKLLQYKKILTDNVLPEGVKKKRAEVYEGEQRLASAQEEIRNCQRKNLQLLTELRDGDVTSLTASIHTFLSSVSECSGEKLLCNVEEVMLELGDCAISQGEFNTMAEAFEVLSKVCSKYTELKNQSKNEISELLQSLADNWQTELRMLQRGLEENDWSPPEPETVVQETFSLCQQLLDSFQNYKNILTEERQEKTPLSFSIQALLLLQAKSQYKQLKSSLGCVAELQQRAEQLSTFISDKPDISILTNLKKDIKAARRIVKLAQIEATSDDEDEVNEGALHEAMMKLHDLYLEEEANLVKISAQAQGPYPELLINHPQLRNIISGEDIVKAGWELSHFVMPNNYMSINSLKQRVLEGIYRDEPAYFVEYSLQNTDETLEEEAIRLIKDNLEGCFAIFIDHKLSRAYGCTKIPPV